MDNTIKIFEYLNIDQRIISLFKSQITIPIISDSYKIYGEKWYAHPPMLLPLFIDYSFPILKGIIIHPFQQRQISFVNYDLEVEYMVEKARNADQFITKMILEMNMIEEEMTPEIIQFCESIEFKNYEQIDEFAEEFGDDPQHLHKLIHFETDTPLTYCKQIDEYTGDFISSEKLFRENVIDTACSFEIANKKWLTGIVTPAWLNNQNKHIDLFNEYYDKDMFIEAWLTLNSYRWHPKDIASCLNKLKMKTENELFILVAENWINNWNKNTNQ